MPSRKNQRGSVLILYTMAITVLAGMTGLAVNVGWAYFQESAAQAAAEAAASAAVVAAASYSASGITCTTNNIGCQAATACPSTITSPANNLGNGCLYAKDNGFQTGGTNQRMLMAANTTGSPVSGLTVQYWVSATAVQTMPLTFLSLLGQNAAVISKTVTAGLVPAVQGDCIYALNKNTQHALVVTGNGDVNSGCGVWVNSSSDKALQVSGNGTLRANSGGINLYGGDKDSNGLCTSPTEIGCMAPTPSKTGSQFSDPLASLPAPAFSGCDFTSQVKITNGTAALSPGVYCGGIAISGGTVTFNPGIYILNGGGLNITSATTTITGSGVMFYNTADASHNFKTISVSGGASVTLSAPTSGTYTNILFFQDRSQGGTSDNNTFSGGSTEQLTGILYFEPSGVTYTGGSSTNVPNMGIVADTVTFTGNGFLQGGITGNGGGSGIKVAIIN